MKWRRSPIKELRVRLGILELRVAELERVGIKLEGTAAQLAQAVADFRNPHYLEGLEERSAGHPALDMLNEEPAEEE